MSPKKDKLVFHDRSSDKVAGEGIHEYTKNKAKYATLNKTKNWRISLTANCVGPLFIYENLSFASVSHAMQYKKLCFSACPLTAYDFSLHSESIYSKQPIGKVKKNTTHQPNFSIGEQLRWKQHESQIQFEILSAKFNQQPYKDILLATKDAELWVYRVGKQLQRAEVLEGVRNRLMY